MKSLWTWLVIMVVVSGVVIYVGKRNSDPKTESSSAKEQAAINIIKSAYIPSVQLLKLNPDIQGAYFSAMSMPSTSCTYQDCYEVFLRVDVMPGAETKTIKAEWLVDATTGENQPTNTEARIMFTPAHADSVTTKPRDTAAGATNAIEAIQESKESDKAEFQRQLPNLARPLPNLRWYPSAIGSSLVTPYGPCVIMMGNASGYSLTSMVVKSGFALYPDKTAAMGAAEQYCRDWYAAQPSPSHDPIQDKDLWFAPDQEP
jgi:hypothetical protein